MADFDYKVFNPQVFEAYTKTVPNLKRNALLSAKVFTVRDDLKARFSAQSGSNYSIEAIKSRISGTVLNYDGSTDITSNSRRVYSQGKVVVGRAQAWGERDFSTDITGGVNFLATAEEVAQYFDDVDQTTLLKILGGIFSMTGTENALFVSEHTTDISAEQTLNKVDATTLNTAIQKACGDNKDIFTVAIMHSAVATNLENLNLLSYIKYTDASGIQRDLSMGTWNGRTVLVDDNMPYANSKYTTYILGKGAFDYCDVGAKVPFEMDRNPATNGGEETLYARTRKLFAPYGISFAPASIPVSPTDSDLVSGASWTLARNSTDATDVFPHKAIPIARIISLG
jgi:hypothetical protein